MKFNYKLGLYERGSFISIKAIVVLNVFEKHVLTSRTRALLLILEAKSSRIIFVLCNSVSITG